MEEAVFVVRLLHIQHECKTLLQEELTDDQLIGLGAEFQKQAEAIIDRFRDSGKYYRRRD